MTAKDPNALSRPEAAKLAWARKERVKKIRASNHKGPTRVVRCADCPKYDRCTKCRAKWNKQQAAKYIERRKKGLCTWCGEPAKKAYCHKHLMQRNKWLKERKERLSLLQNVNALKPLRKAGKQDEQEQKRQDTNS